MSRSGRPAVVDRLAPLCVAVMAGSARAGELPEAEAGEIEIVGQRDPEAWPAVVVRPEQAPSARDLADIVGLSPGVAVRRLGGAGAWAGVSLRGAAMRQVQVFLDGVPLNPDGSTAVNLAELPLGLVQDVRIFRAFAPPSFGAAAVGGVVDVTTRPAGAGLGRTTLSAGSLGYLRAAGSAGVGAPRAGLSGLVGLEALTSHGRFAYLDDRGTRFVDSDDAVLVRQHAGIAQGSGLLRLGLEGGAWKVSLVDVVGARQEQFAGPVGAPAREAALGVTSNLLAVQVGGVVGPVGLRALGWRSDRSAWIADPGGEVGIGGRLQRDRIGATGGALGVVWAPGRAVDLSADLQLRQEGLTRELDGSTSLNEGRTAIGGSLAARGALGPYLELWPVLDLRGLRSGGGWISQAAPRLSITTSPVRGLDVALQAGRVWRPPDLLELYGQRGAVGSQAGLRPERGWMVDLGVHAAGQRPGLSWSVGCNGFVRFVDDLIAWIQNAQRSLVPVNVGRARVTGVEALLTVDLPGHLSVMGQASWQDPRNLSGDSAAAGHRLPAVPSFLADLRISGWFVPQAGLGASVEASSGQFQDITNRLAVPARLTGDVWWETRLAREGLSVLVGVRNVADTTTAVVPRDPLHPESGTLRQPLTDVAGWPVPGRTFFATLTWTGGAP